MSVTERFSDQLQYVKELCEKLIAAKKFHLINNLIEGIEGEYRDAYIEVPGFERYADVALWIESIGSESGERYDQFIRVLFSDIREILKLSEIDNESRVWSEIRNFLHNSDTYQGCVSYVELVVMLRIKDKDAFKTCYTKYAIHSGGRNTRIRTIDTEHIIAVDDIERNLSSFVEEIPNVLKSYEAARDFVTLDHFSLSDGGAYICISLPESDTPEVWDYHDNSVRKSY